MSTKQKLVKAIDALPDALSPEEAVGLLYRLYRFRGLLGQRQRKAPVCDAVSARKLRLAPVSESESGDLTISDADYLF